MDWLKSHEYLAVWLTLPLMTLIAVLQSSRAEGKGVGVPRMAIYFAFMICLAAVFTPTLDDDSRVFAALMCVPLLVIVTYHAYVELLNTYPKMPGDGNSDSNQQPVSTNT